MIPADFSLSRHDDLEYEYGTTPLRAFLPTAPIDGYVELHRFTGDEVLDARGRPGNTRVDVVAVAPPGGIAGRYLLPAPICVHSPTGFEWGYGGSGPADLAANILAVFVDRREAWRLHQDYKGDAIARIARDGARLSIAAIRGWLERRWATERLDVQLMAEEDAQRRDAAGIGDLDLDDVGRRAFEVTDDAAERRARQLEA